MIVLKVHFFVGQIIALLSVLMNFFSFGFEFAAITHVPLCTDRLSVPRQKSVINFLKLKTKGKLEKY